MQTTLASLPEDEGIEMEDAIPSQTKSNPIQSESSSSPQSGLMGAARHTLGLALLLVVVFLWTASNFLSSVRIYHHLFPLTYLCNLSEHFCRRDIRQTLLFDISGHIVVHSHAYSGFREVRIPAVSRQAFALLCTQRQIEESHGACVIKSF